MGQEHEQPVTTHLIGGPGPTRSAIPSAWRPWRYLIVLWLWITDRFRTLLRTIGLGIATFVGADRPEPPKELISNKRRLAIARCAIHILPACVSIVLVVINLVGYFIGSELQGLQGQDDIKLSVLQLAAKAQELLIVSSCGTIIFDLLRSELMFGNGLPLGLLVSGFNFSQLR